MLLKCSKCGQWHAVELAQGNVGESEHAKEMMFWLCRGERFYAGQRGSVGRRPLADANRFTSSRVVPPSARRANHPGDPTPDWFGLCR